MVFYCRALKNDLELDDYADQPGAFGAAWTIRLNITPMVPRGIHNRITGK